MVLSMQKLSKQKVPLVSFFLPVAYKPYWVLALHFLHLNMYLPLQFFRLSCRHLLSLSAPYIECNYANCHPPKSECAMHNMIYLRFLFTPSKAVLSRSKNKARLLKSRPLCIWYIFFIKVLITALITYLLMQVIKVS